MLIQPHLLVNNLHEGLQPHGFLTTVSVCLKCLMMSTCRCPPSKAVIDFRWLAAFMVQTNNLASCSWCKPWWLYNQKCWRSNIQQIGHWMTFDDIKTWQWRSSRTRSVGEFYIFGVSYIWQLRALTTNSPWTFPALRTRETRDAWL